MTGLCAPCYNSIPAMAQDVELASRQHELTIQAISDAYCNGADDALPALRSKRLAAMERIARARIILWELRWL